MSTSRRPRYFKNDAPLTRRDPHKQLLASLTRLVTQYPPASVPPGGGLYYGPISIAFLFFKLQVLYPELVIEGLPVTNWAGEYLKRAEEHMRDYPGPTLDKCGIAEDVMAMLALGAASAKDEDMAKELCDYATMTGDKDAGVEWLYGKAGYLYLLRLVKATFTDDEKVRELIDDTADLVIESLINAPRPWKWHGKAYVGAVHGAIGVITQIVLTDPTWARDLEVELATLLSYQYESGNWPSSIPPGRDRLVQFCHGAPGVVTSLLSIQQFFPKLKDKIDLAVQKGRQAILERGLLTKEPCLCHGISGNAMALEDAEFEHFLSYTTGHEIKSMDKDGVMEKSDDPSSLWCGEAGRAWAWAIADKGLEKRFLGYNDL